MPHTDETSLIWLFASLELLGLVSALLVRVTQGSRREALAQELFLWVLGAMGLATFFSMGLHPGYWLSCGSVLSIMALGAVWDPRKTGHLTVW